VALEDRTARLTILIDPRKKAYFERLSAEACREAVRDAACPCAAMPLRLFFDYPAM
jgi:Ribbon-helix-helix protein